MSVPLIASKSEDKQKLYLVHTKFEERRVTFVYIHGRPHHWQQAKARVKSKEAVIINELRLLRFNKAFY